MEGVQNTDFLQHFDPVFGNLSLGRIKLKGDIISSQGKTKVLSVVAGDDGFQLGKTQIQNTFWCL